MKIVRTIRKISKAPLSIVLDTTTHASMNGDVKGTSCSSSVIHTAGSSARDGFIALLDMFGFENARVRLNMSPLEKHKSKWRKECIDFFGIKLMPRLRKLLKIKKHFEEYSKLANIGGSQFLTLRVLAKKKLDRLGEYLAF